MLSDETNNRLSVKIVTLLLYVSLQNSNNIYVNAHLITYIMNLYVRLGLDIA